MNKFINAVLLVIASIFISSCSSELEDYKESEAPFDIKTYFDGKVTAWGIVQDHTNEVKRRFCVELTGTWNGNNGLLAEKFYFNDGEISYRNWQLSKQDDGSYKGTAEDIVGTATGKNKGFAFQFQYTLQLKVEDDIYNITVDDWIYQLDEYRVMNKASMSKFGVEVAEITLFFDKELPVKNCQAKNAS